MAIDPNRRRDCKEKEEAPQMNVKQLTRFGATTREIRERAHRLAHENHPRQAFNENYERSIVWLRSKPDADFSKGAIQIRPSSPQSVLRLVSVNVSTHPKHPDRRPLIIESRPSAGETWIVFPHGVATVVHDSGACARVPDILAIIE